MQSYQVSQLKEKIRVALDENMSSTALAELGDIDTLSLDELIESKIEDAARIVVQEAPLSLLSDMTTPYTTMSVSATAPYKATVDLPDDFLRLASIKLRSWPYAVYEVLPSDAPLYIQAHSPYGVVGTKDRPLVFMSVGANAKKTLELFSASGSSDTLSCLYIKQPKIADNAIQLGTQIVRPVVYYAASLVALAIKDKEAADNQLQVCKELLGIS